MLLNFFKRKKYNKTKEINTKTKNNIRENWQSPDKEQTPPNVVKVMFFPFYPFTKERE